MGFEFEVGGIIVDSYNYICKIFDISYDRRRIGLSFKPNGEYCETIDVDCIRKASPAEVQMFYNCRDNHVESKYHEHDFEIKGVEA